MGYFLDDVECRIAGRTRWVLGSAALDDGCGWDAISLELFTRMGGDELKDLEPELTINVELADKHILTPRGWTNIVCEWDGGTKKMKGRFIVLPELSEDIFFSKNIRWTYDMRKSASKKGIGGKIWMLKFPRKPRRKFR
jgi:hypothetical protein